MGAVPTNRVWAPCDVYLTLARTSFKLLGRLPDSFRSAGGNSRFHGSGTPWSIKGTAIQQHPGLMSPEAQRSGKEETDRCIGQGPRRLGEARGGASFSFAIFRTFFHKYHSIFVRSNSLFFPINSYLYANSLHCFIRFKECLCFGNITSSYPRRLKPSCYLVG